MGKSTSSRDTPPIHDVDLRLLRIFKSVVEFEGFSAAEEHLGIGRSTISKHISGLEERLNVRLCERGRSGFSVTPHGRTVYAATIELLDALESFRSKVSTAKGRLSGNVSIWVMDNSHNEAGLPLTAALSRFKKRPGNAHISLNAASPRSVEEAVESGAAHIGTTIANAGISGITYVPIGEELTSIYCSAEHPIAEPAKSGHVTDEMLANSDFVMRGYLRNELNFKRSSKSTATTGHVEATLQLVLTGHYIGVIPDHIANRWVTTGRLVKLPLPDTPGRAVVYLIYRDKARANPTVSAFIEDIVDCYSKS